MKTSIKLSLLAIATVTLIAAGMYMISTGNTSKGSDKSAAEAIFAASFHDLQGKPQALSQWRGKILVVNFWATWCPPCIAEIPEFIQAQKQYGEQGVQFIGIAIDKKDKVQTFAQDTGMNYPVLLSELDGMDLARQLGNADSGLPFSVIIDRNGKVVSTKLGKLSREKLEYLIKSLL